MSESPSQGMMGWDDRVAEIRRGFSEGLPARLESMRVALGELTQGYEQAMAETFYQKAHSLVGTAPSFGAHELAGHAALLADLGRRWLKDREVTPEQMSDASDKLERLTSAVQRYRARVQGGEAP